MHDLVNYAYRRTHNWHDAEDVAQEALACLLAQGKMDAPLKYQHSVICNLIVSHNRQNEVRIRKSPLVAISIEVIDPRTNEIADQIKRAMANLSDDDQAILRASVIDGLSGKQMEKQFGLNSALVRKRKQLALKKLKRQLIGMAV
jgi:RNA polymerase sigma factor (sigma-70 family)